MRLLKQTLLLVKHGAAALLLVVVPLTLPFAHAASAAAPTTLGPSAQVSFTFDDGLQSASTQAAPTLAKYGLSGVDYIITNCVGMTTTPNTCRANKTTPYMTWAQIKALQNTYDWEIGSHTVDHDCLASNGTIDPGDCQKNTLTTAQVDQELSGSKTALAAQGINATDFAPPYGDYNNNVLAEIAKYYATMRGFQNTAGNQNVWPYDDYLLQDMTVQETTDTVASVEAQIDAAISSKHWLVLTFHNIMPVPSTNPNDYEYGTAELDQIAAYVKAKQDAGLIQTTHVDQSLTTGTANLLPNSTFNDGIADGWTTDNATAVKADAGNHGSYPDPTNAVSLTAGATDAHLFSPKVAVDAQQTYLLKSFLNVTKITSGGIGYYIDEYDANGNWISGQWKKQETDPFVENMNFEYKPTSLAVKSASLQIILPGNSGAQAYVDNAQWYSEDQTVTPPTNIVPNGTFDDGIADGWHTDDPANIVADNNNDGGPASPVNSVKIVASTGGANTHLFSPFVAIDPSKKYEIDSFLNLTAINSGEIGYYIDEYDSGGNWISGQWKASRTSITKGNVGIAYTPSSANVKQASLQIIVVPNSGIQAYIDDIDWYATT